VWAKLDHHSEFDACVYDASVTLVDHDDDDEKGGMPVNRLIDECGATSLIEVVQKGGWRPDDDMHPDEKDWQLGTVFVRSTVNGKEQFIRHNMDLIRSPNPPSLVAYASKMQTLCPFCQGVFVEEPEYDNHYDNGVWVWRPELPPDRHWRYIADHRQVCRLRGIEAASINGLVYTDDRFRQTLTNEECASLIAEQSRSFFDRIVFERPSVFERLGPLENNPVGKNTLYPVLAVLPVQERRA